MTDLVQKYREAVRTYHGWKDAAGADWDSEKIAQWLSEAADEIERLQRELADRNEECDVWKEMFERQGERQTIIEIDKDGKVTRRPMKETP